MNRRIRIERFKWTVPVLEKNSSIIVCLTVLFFVNFGDIYGLEYLGMPCLLQTCVENVSFMRNNIFNLIHSNAGFLGLVGVGGVQFLYLSLF